jgi:uncharacterized protein
VSGRPFAASYGPWAVVGGGSEGLGAAFAAELAARGLNLVLVARREEPLAAAAARLGRKHAVEVVTVATDLAAPGAAGQVARAVRDRPVGLVVANAALSPTGPFSAATAQQLATAVDLNCRAPVLLAREFLPAMTERGRGGLILVSSLAGLQGVPQLAVYSASKAFLIHLAQALWAETRGSGVDVIAACPGAVTTPSYGRAAQHQAPGAQTPEQVASQTLAALGRGFTVVPGRLNRVNAVTIGRLMPKRAAIWVFGRATRAALGDHPGSSGAAPPTAPGRLPP